MFSDHGQLIKESNSVPSPGTLGTLLFCDVSGSVTMFFYTFAAGNEMKTSSALVLYLLENVMCDGKVLILILAQAALFMSCDSKEPESHTSRFLLL